MRMLCILYLDGYMTDAEVHQPVLHFTQDSLTVPNRLFAVDDHMAGERIATTRDAPDVQIMDIVNTGSGSNRLCHFLKINAFGRSLHENADRLLYDSPSSKRDQQGDQNT